MTRQRRCVWLLVAAIVSHGAAAQSKKSEPAPVGDKKDVGGYGGCDYGFTDKGNVCTKMESTPKVLVCGPHAKLEGDKCVRIIKIHPFHRCPEGYDLRGTHKCLKVDGVPPEPMCPKGLELTEAGRCQKRSDVLPELVCKHGGTLKHDKCVESIESRAVPHCPAGCTLSSGEKKNAASVCQCITQEGALPSCPREYKMESDECTKTDSYAPTITCDGMKHGAGSKDGKCESIQTYSPSPSCPKGYSMEASKGSGHSHHGSGGAECVSSEKGAKKTAPMQTICDKGGEMKHGKCVKTSHAPGIPTCNKGGSLVDETCIHKETVPVQYTCSDGNMADSTKYGNKCTKTTTAPMKMMCKNGAVGKDGKCTRSKDRGAPMLECPKGTEEKKEDGELKCEKLVDKNPILLCPDGTKFNDDVGVCINLKETAPVERFCPDDFELEIKKPARKKKKEQAICKKIEIKAPVPICPHGYTDGKDSHSCYKEVSLPKMPGHGHHDNARHGGHGGFMGTEAEYEPPMSTK